MHRIRDALIKYKPPNVEFVDTPEEGAIHILDFIGQHPTIEDRILHPYTGLMRAVPSTPKTKKYVLIYHCWHSENINKFDYNSLFQNASVVITHSPYLAQFHECFSPMKIDYKKVNFYVTCWGYDPDVFYESNLKRIFTILATGYIAEDERLTQVYRAVKSIDGKMVHVGGNIGLQPNNHYIRLENIPDSVMCYLYNQSKYVNAIRLPIGFEVVGIEGLACGCTPIYLDSPAYRYWFKDWGLFVKQDNETEELIKIFKLNLQPRIDKDKFKKTFSWEYVAPKIWNTILTSI